MSKKGYSDYKNRRKLKKFLMENAETAMGTPKHLFKKTPEQIESLELSLKLRPRAGGYWRRCDEG